MGNSNFGVHDGRARGILRAMNARVLSINLGQPRTVPYEGRTVRTAIWKHAVHGPARLTRLGFEGDGQADRRYHGGPTRAAYLYPHEHYAHWEPRLGGGPLPMGQFGENVTTEGLLETEAHVGDVYVVGAARIRLASPRVPCFKLGLRTGDPAILAPFLASGRLGFYASVLEEGQVEAGDPITLLHRDPGAATWAELIAALYLADPSEDAVERALASPALTADQRDRIERQRRARA
jgi:MOSC domain-containing protein YiiM